MNKGSPFSTTVRRVALALAAMAFALFFISEVASAQSWWPFGGGGDDRSRDRQEDSDRPPVPEEPVYRQPPPGQPQGPPPSAYPSAPPQSYPSSPPPQAGVPAAPPQSSASTYRNPICLQLEQRLVQENQKNGQSQNDLPRIENEIRQLERVVDQSQSRLDHGCYDYFLFTKSLRDSPQCKDLSHQVDTSKRRLSDLDAQRQDILGSSGRSYQDDIVRELARNNCGANYSAMAHRSGGDNGGMWEDEESSGGNTWNPHAANGAQTYRTMCVRMCDGFYFPVSFSTLPSHFEQDADVCSSHCAAPSELFYYPNPGGTVEQAVAMKDQAPYTKLKFAFRYRKEYVKGCSCKAADYVAPEGEADKKAEGTSQQEQVLRQAAAARPAPPSSGSATGVQSETLPDATTQPQQEPAAPSGEPGGWQTQAEPQQ